MNPAAVYIIAISAAGVLLACAAFVWAALRGEFTDASEAALLVFDDDGGAAEREDAA